MTSNAYSASARLRFGTRRLDSPIERARAAILRALSEPTAAGLLVETAQRESRASFVETVLALESLIAAGVVRSEFSDRGGRRILRVDFEE